MILNKKWAVSETIANSHFSNFIDHTATFRVKFCNDSGVRLLVMCEVEFKKVLNNGDLCYNIYSNTGVERRIASER